MDEDRLIPVSPRHSVLLAPELIQLLERPPQHDFLVRTLAKRHAGNMPLMAAELVIAGYDTRQQYPLAQTYPLHFRKTYFPGRLHGDPKDEFEHLQLASELLDLPPPIGFSPAVFRSCLIPGKPFNRVSPFGAEPEESNIDRAHKLTLAAAAGLWRLAENAFHQLMLLHDGGLAHGDAELHNFIVCPSPLELIVIDFEAAVKQDKLAPDAWHARCALDLAPLLREAVFIQCALGRQSGALADLAWQRMDSLVRDADRFRRAIEREASTA